MIADNLASVRQRIAKSCEKAGRAPSDVLLIAVSKTADIRAIEEAAGLGVKDFGENRVQELVRKSRELGRAVAWHAIGRLQTNKVRHAVGAAAVIHSVDSLRLAQEIDREAAAAGKRQDVLIQVNVSGEATKSGVRPDEAGALVRQACGMEHLRVVGMMTMAPEYDDPERARPVFAKLRQMRDAMRSGDAACGSLGELSMGMTNDFEVAVEEGATMVRIGRAIFGEAVH